MQAGIPSVNKKGPPTGSKLPVIYKPEQLQSKCKPISGTDVTGAPGAITPVYGQAGAPIAQLQD